MKNKLWKIMIVNSILISAITLSGKTTVSVQAEETELSAESETDQQILCDDAVEDALIIDKDEILPVVSLEEDSHMPFTIRMAESFFIHSINIRTVIRMAQM